MSHFVSCENQGAKCLEEADLAASEAWPPELAVALRGILAATGNARWNVCNAAAKP